MIADVRQVLGLWSGESPGRDHRPWAMNSPWGVKGPWGDEQEGDTGKKLPAGLTG